MSKSTEANRKEYLACNNNLRTYRHKLGLRQTDMAAIMGFEVIDRISHWEKGQAYPGLINLLRLCVLFEAQPQELFPELYERIQKEVQESRVKNIFS